jgi:hypothetical protein
MTTPAPPADVYNAVHPVAAQAGVPDPIWETVAYMESGYNPNAVGDAGTSFGLFQLHEGGQLRTSPSSVRGTGGERLNALEAMPAIGSAWQNLGKTFSPGDLNWWTNFAIQSGHPGGSPGDPATKQAADVMMQDFAGSNMNAFQNVGTPGLTLGQSTGDCPWYCALTPFATWGPCGNCGASNPNSALGNVNQSISDITSGPWWARVGIVILGGGLIVIGAIKLMK